MNRIKYIFATQYSPYPGGRFIRLGEYSGEDFRETVLVPVVESGDFIEIDATGVKLSFSPSFLDEAFGGLVKKYGLKKVKETISFSAKDNRDLEGKMWSFAEKADKS